MLIKRIAHLSQALSTRGKDLDKWESDSLNNNSKMEAGNPKWKQQQKLPIRKSNPNKKNKWPRL